jgi:hypothetical protein
MEVSGFLVMTNNFTYNRRTFYKNLIFARFGDKIFVNVFNYVGSSVIMLYSDFVKNECLNTYYELSRAAIGKPNIDKEYYCSNNPDYTPTKYEKENNMFVDTIYIVEDDLTHAKVAKKGNTSQSLNVKKLKKMKVSTDKEIEEFFVNYNKNYGFEEENFEERKATYTALVNNL